MDAAVVGLRCSAEKAMGPLLRKLVPAVKPAHGRPDDRGHRVVVPGVVHGPEDRFTSVALVARYAGQQRVKGL